MSTKKHVDSHYRPLISLEWLLRQVTRIPGPKTQRKGWINVVCPFHRDTHPSLGICIKEGSSHIGHITCWSCGTKGDWNKLADKLGLSRIEQADAEDYPLMPPIVYETDSQIFGTSTGLLTEEQLWADHKLDLITDWPTVRSWRTISGSLLYSLGAKAGLRYGEQMLWMPVTLEQELVGSWIGRMQKPVKLPQVGSSSGSAGSKQNTSSYLNSSGTWIQTQGLWPYDHVAGTMLKGRKNAGLPVILVEGQRDALRLISNGIPALCVFGTNNIGDEKVSLVMGLERRVYLMGDGDDAGREFNKRAKKLFREQGEMVKTISLPDGTDPADLDGQQIKDLKGSLSIK
jgi:hypothetical protein